MLKNLDDVVGTVNAALTSLNVRPTIIIVDALNQVNPAAVLLALHPLHDYKTNQPINQLTDQSINQLINQLHSQSIS